MPSKIEKSDQEWQEQLSPEQYEILRKKGTERAFTGKYWDEESPGIYCCAGCGLELFSSENKYESGTGWPSFDRPIDPSHVETLPDNSFGKVRTEILCSRCGGHLGHVFSDGPRETTGTRYCTNSASLELIPRSG